jgi:hypothetical protein
MSLEKGINRLGTVTGVIVGAIYSLGFYFNFQDWFSEQNKWASSSERFSDTIVFMGPIAIAVLLFFVVFFVAKGVFKVTNWVIRGFRE